MAGPSRAAKFASSARKIANTSRDLMAFLGASRTRTLPRRSSTAIEIPPLNLPLPEELLDVVLAYDVPPAVMEGVQQTLRNALLQLQTECKNKYIKTCQALSDLPDTSASRHRLQQINKTFTKLYITRHAPRLREQVIAQLETKLAAPPSKKQAFNVHYIPVLEKYFEYNAYPTAQDRALLARKSMMSARQIEVWFQNHRRRARKEGKPLQRPSPDTLPVQICLDSLEQEMAPFVSHKRERCPSADLNPRTRFPTPPAEPSPSTSRSGSLGPQHPKQDNVLDHAISPMYAFPTKFSELPNIGVDPFPCKQGPISLPAPVWASRSHTRPQREPCSVTELCDAFGMMRIAGSPSKASSSSPWYSSRCNGPIVAPLPALIRPSLPRPSLIVESSEASRSKSPRSVSSSCVRTKQCRQSTLRTCLTGCPAQFGKKSLARASSNSSLSSQGSWSDLETPESSPNPSSTIGLPSVYGVDEVHFAPMSDPSHQASSVAFESYAALCPKTFTEALSWSLSTRHSASLLP
uniref:A mating type protein n=1 Tax=Coprinopsis cinerea TaxID=5346 RepID=Q00352_COPCI|nr:A mating type protein [Coprinopsis cinerea]